MYAAVFHQRVFQQGSQVHLACAGTSRGILDFQQVGAANQFIHGMHAQAGHVFAQILGHKTHKVDDVFRLALKALAQLGVLGADAHGAGIQVAHAHHHAAHGNQRAGAKAELFSAQHGGNGHIAAAHQLAVGFNAHAGAQAVHDQALVCFGKAQLPRQAGIVDGVARCSAGTAVKTGNQNHFGAGLGNAGGNGANTGFADQLDVDGSLAVGAFQVIDQLGQVLNGVDIMVRRGRDQAHAGGGVAGLGNPGVNLAAGQLAALAGLCALCHLDLNLTGGNQILAGHAKTGGCHLLDGAVALGAKTVFGFAAFAGVALAADAVHGNGHALVGFLRKGTIAHGSGLEAVYDGIHAFHFVQRDTGIRIIEVQQAAQVHGIAALGVHGIGISLELVVIAGPAGLLQQVDGQRVVQMIFGQLAAAELVLTQAGQLHADIQAQRVECLFVAGFQVVLDVADGNAAHTADGVGKVLIHYLVAQTQRFKNLAALVGLDGGNAHLGGNLDDAGQNGFIVVVHGGIVIFVQQTLIDQLADGLLCQIGVDGAGTVAQQGGKIMNLAGLTAFQDQGHGGALAGTNQILGNCAHSQKAGDGDMVLINFAVRQNQDVGTIAVGAVHINEQAVNGLFQVGVLIVADGDGFHLKAGNLHGLDLHQVGFGQNGVGDFQHLAVLGVLFQQVALCANVYGGGGHDLFAQGVDGRVGDLGKHLLKVLKQRGMGVAQNGQRGIAAHGTGGLCAVLCHRQDHGGNILVLVAECFLQPYQLVMLVAGHTLVGNLQIGQVDQVAVQPFAVRLAAGVIGFQAFVVHQLTPGGIHQQHFAGAQAVLAHDFFGGNIQHADLTGKDQAAVFGDIVAAGAQTVAIQHSAHHIAVTEQDGSGAVPRFQHGGVILIERTLFGVHTMVVLPRFGDSDHNSQRQLHAVHNHKLQRVIQHGGVGTTLVDDGQDLGHILFQVVGTNGFLAGQHGIHVAADGVDLAVMQDKAVGVGAVPAGCRVGRKTAVHHADGRFIIFALQIGIEQAQFFNQEHALVHNGAAGKTAHISILAGLFKHAAGNIKLAVKVNAGLYAGRAFHKCLPDAGHAGTCLVAQNFRAGGHFAPAKEVEPLFFADDLKQLFVLVAVQLFLWEKEHANAVVTLVAQRNAGFFGSFFEELVADLQQDTDTIAGFAFGILTGTVFQVLHDLQSIVDRFVGFAALDIHNCTNAAVVMFKPRIIQPGGGLALCKVFHPFFAPSRNSLRGRAGTHISHPGIDTKKDVPQRVH